MTPALPVRPRLVATDLDGTLLRGDGRVSARTQAVLHAVQAAGVDVVFVTARPPRWLAEVAAAVGGHGTVICLNGAIVYDAAARTVLASSTLADALVRTLTADLRAALPGIVFAAERSTGLATEARFEHEHQVPPDAVHTVLLEDALVGDATGKLLARCSGVPDDQLVASVAHVLGDRAIVADSGARGLAEISPAGVTKAAALARWAHARGMGPGDVWAFGDMPNDLPMLAWAGRSFAVANAHPDVLAAADHVCGSNEEDGVAAVLEQLFATG